MSTGSAATDGANLRDFREAFRITRERKRTVRYATCGKVLRTWRNPACELRALSPSDEEFTVFLGQIARMRPTRGRPYRTTTATTPNFVSVVLHIQCPEFSVLLGADMEAHSDSRRGWAATVSEGQRGAIPRAELLKVPHHGSYTGHYEDMWTVLLGPQPYGIVTPFNRLSKSRKLPTLDDLNRLSDRTARLFITSSLYGSTQEPRAAEIEKSLAETKIRVREKSSTIGLVRARKSRGGGWIFSSFAPAHEFQRRESEGNNRTSA